MACISVAFAGGTGSAQADVEGADHRLRKLNGVPVAATFEDEISGVEARRTFNNAFKNMSAKGRHDELGRLSFSARTS
ncbi:hypothetical protein [Bradyrhizobium sp. AUGA SZCCT0182]|uniref:hypothetical protein n=1 Tax=Bradyrhizobium sp. AUGA SZCCT0182 TaxID=2807667 RepID=UPI001BA4A779|nr:hypothetical protein [Bradyrhizobium sp. AUGA SZCCT0182]MBR1237567.1 hypothetical protein [Bradyrhizobium sp. AUGA SZCCT0182]